MTVNTIEIDKSGRVIVNGVKLMWVNAADLSKFGDNSMSLKERFELLLEYKRGGSDIKQLKSSNNKGDTRIEIDRKHPEPFINSRNKKLTFISKDSFFEEMEDVIDNLAKEYYSIYKGIAFIDLDDIKSELYLIALELFDKLDSTKFSLTKNNKSTFIFILKHRYCHKIHKELGKYTHILNSDYNIFESIKDCVLQHTDLASLDDEDYVDAELLQEAVNCFREAHEDALQSSESDEYKLLKLYESLVRNGVHEEDKVDGIDVIGSVIDKVANEEIHKIISTLTYREQYVLIKRFGLDGGKSHTLEEVGHEIDCSRPRVQQIEARAIHRLRAYFWKHKFGMSIEDYITY